MKIPITKAWFGPEEMRAIQIPLETGWVVQGPFVREFEQKFAAYVGSPFAAATTSCTTALHLAVASLGLKPGDEVLVPALTWVATANVVEYMGATPVFCDIDLNTFNVDASQLDARITPRTVGILPVHLFGLCADMPRILEIARKYGLWIVEDAACGFGAWIGKRHAGTFGEFGCFSFHPRKAITTGEGGMVTVRNSAFDAKVRSLRDHGATKSDLARHQAKASFLLSDYPHVGFNYRMTDLQGALGSMQMDRADSIQMGRTNWANAYHEKLRDLDWLRLSTIPTGFTHGYQSFVTRFEPESPNFHSLNRLHEQRNTLMASLEDHGVATRQGTHAPVLLEYYRTKYGLRAEDYPNAVLADRLSITLPLYAQMTDEEHDYVCERLVSARKLAIAA